jgi:hypothetical protein
MTASSLSSRRPILGLKQPVTVVLPPELRPKAAMPRTSILKTPAPRMPPPAQRNNQMTTLTGRSLKVTIPLVPDELLALRVPDGVSRVTLRIAVAGRAVTADVAAKSQRKAIATIREVGVEHCVALIQGKLGPGDEVLEAGLIVTVKAPVLAA